MNYSQWETVCYQSPNLLSSACSLCQLHDVVAEIAETIHQFLLTRCIADTLKVVFNLAHATKVELMSLLADCN